MNRELELLLLVVIGLLFGVVGEMDRRDAEEAAKFAASERPMVAPARE